jgi:hypothetical protein
MEVGDAPPVSITISPLPPGDSIQQVEAPCSGNTCGLGSGGTLYRFCNSSISLSGESVSGCTKTLLIQPAAPTGTYIVFGFISGSPADTCTTWDAQDPSGTTTRIQSNDPSNPFSAAEWTANGFGTYAITMTTTSGTCGQGGAQFGTTTVMVTLAALR